MADIILYNANIITMDSHVPRAETVYIKNGKILAVGGKRIYKGYRSINTELINCHNRTIVPGMIDAHFHFFAFSYSFLSCNFSPNEVRSITHIKNKISNFAKHVPRGNWIRAGVYD
jgi:predicted amidohydrolase YtcJ